MMIVKKIIAILLGGLIAAISMAVFAQLTFDGTQNEFFYDFYSIMILYSITSLIMSAIFLISLIVIGLKRADNLFKLGLYSFLYQILLFNIQPYIDFGAWYWLIIFAIGLALNAIFYKAWQRR